MLLYNLIEYSDNYSDTFGPLWQFKTNEVPNNNADLTGDNSQSFKYKAAFIGKAADAVNNTNSFVKNTEIIVSLKCLRNQWRSLEEPLINCKINLELNWIEDCISSSAQDSAEFKVTDAKLQVSLVTSTKDNENLTKRSSNGCKISVCWKNYQTIPAKVINNDTSIYELLSPSFQGIRRLFALAYDAIDDN